MTKLQTVYTILKKLKEEIKIKSFPELFVKILETILRIIQLPLKLFLLIIVLFISLCVYFGSVLTKEYEYRDICKQMISQVICKNWITLILYKK